MPSAQPRQVFRVSWLRRGLALVAVVAGLWVGGSVLTTLPAGGLLQADPWFAALALLLGLLLGAILIVWVWSAFATHLVVTPGGLEYHELGYVISAAWHEVQRVKTVRFLSTGRPGPSEEEGLVLERSQVRVNPVCARLFHLPGGTEFIPLTPLAGNWRSTDLGDAVFRYAPHLRVDTTSAHKPPK